MRKLPSSLLAVVLLSYFVIGIVIGMAGKNCSNTQETTQEECIKDE